MSKLILNQTIAMRGATNGLLEAICGTGPDTTDRHAEFLHIRETIKMSLAHWGFNYHPAPLDLEHESHEELKAVDPVKDNSIIGKWCGSGVVALPNVETFVKHVDKLVTWIAQASGDQDAIDTLLEKSVIPVYRVYHEFCTKRIVEFMKIFATEFFHSVACDLLEHGYEYPKMKDTLVPSSVAEFVAHAKSMESRSLSDPISVINEFYNPAGCNPEYDVKQGSMTFTSVITVRGLPEARGHGRNKKDAKMNSARAFIEQMNVMSQTRLDWSLALVEIIARKWDAEKPIINIGAKIGDCYQASNGMMTRRPWRLRWVNHPRFPAWFNRVEAADEQSEDEGLGVVTNPTFRDFEHPIAPARTRKVPNFDGLDEWDQDTADNPIWEGDNKYRDDLRELGKAWAQKRGIEKVAIPKRPGIHTTKMDPLDVLVANRFIRRDSSFKAQITAGSPDWHIITVYPFQHDDDTGVSFHEHLVVVGDAIPYGNAPDCPWLDDLLECGADEPDRFVLKNATRRLTRREAMRLGVLLGVVPTSLEREGFDSVAFPFTKEVHDEKLMGPISLSHVSGRTNDMLQVIEACDSCSSQVCISGHCLHCGYEGANLCRPEPDRLNHPSNVWVIKVYNTGTKDMYDRRDFIETKDNGSCVVGLGDDGLPSKFRLKDACHFKEDRDYRTHAKDDVLRFMSESKNADFTCAEVYSYLKSVGSGIDLVNKTATNRLLYSMVGAELSIDTSRQPPVFALKKKPKKELRTRADPMSQSAKVMSVLAVLAALTGASDAIKQVGIGAIQAPGPLLYNTTSTGWSATLQNGTCTQQSSTIFDYTCWASGQAIGCFDNGWCFWSVSAPVGSTINEPCKTGPVVNDGIANFVNASVYFCAEIYAPYKIVGGNPLFAVDISSSLSYVAKAVAQEVTTSLNCLMKVFPHSAPVNIQQYLAGLNGTKELGQFIYNTTTFSRVTTSLVERVGLATNMTTIYYMPNGSIACPDVSVQTYYGRNISTLLAVVNTTAVWNFLYYPTGEIVGGLLFDTLCGPDLTRKGYVQNSTKYWSTNSSRILTMLCGDRAIPFPGNAPVPLQVQTELSGLKGWQLGLVIAASVVGSLAVLIVLVAVVRSRGIRITGRVAGSVAKDACRIVAWPLRKAWCGIAKMAGKVKSRYVLLALFGVAGAQCIVTDNSVSSTSLYLSTSNLTSCAGINDNCTVGVTISNAITIGSGSVTAYAADQVDMGLGQVAVLNPVLIVVRETTATEVIAMSSVATLCNPDGSSFVRNSDCPENVNCCGKLGMGGAGSQPPPLPVTEAVCRGCNAYGDNGCIDQVNDDFWVCEAVGVYRTGTASPEDGCGLPGSWHGCILGVEQCENSNVTATFFNPSSSSISSFFSVQVGNVTECVEVPSGSTTVVVNGLTFKWDVPEIPDVETFQVIINNTNGAIFIQLQQETLPSAKYPFITTSAATPNDCRFADFAINPPFDLVGMDHDGATWLMLTSDFGVIGEDPMIALNNFTFNDGSGISCTPGDWNATVDGINPILNCYRTSPKLPAQLTISGQISNIQRLTTPPVITSLYVFAATYTGIGMESKMWVSGVNGGGAGYVPILVYGDGVVPVNKTCLTVPGNFSCEPFGVAIVDKMQDFQISMGGQTGEFQTTALDQDTWFHITGGNYSTFYEQNGSGSQDLGSWVSWFKMIGNLFGDAFLDILAGMTLWVAKLVSILAFIAFIIAVIIAFLILIYPGMVLFTVAKFLWGASKSTYAGVRKMAKNLKEMRKPPTTWDGKRITTDEAFGSPAEDSVSVTTMQSSRSVNMSTVNRRAGGAGESMKSGLDALDRKYGQKVGTRSLFKYE